MRSLRLVPVLGLAAAALAQDSVASRPVGTLLHDALPPAADLVVHVPSVPAFLESAADAGFGTPEAWRDAFRAQLRRWGEPSGEAERLVTGAESLLRMADGEAVVASMELPRLGVTTASRARAAFFAFRSSAKEKELREAVQHVIAGGLRVRYPGEPRTEQTMGRPVIALSGAWDGLWIRVQDHLVAVSDHPLALGLFFRGMERVAREGRPPEDVSAFRVRVRWGRTDSPLRWDGTTFLQREAVTAGTKTSSRGAAALPEGPSVVTWVADEAADCPIFPVRLPDAVGERAKTISARPLAVRLLPDGTFDVAGAAPAGPDAKPLAGSATRGAWLRAIAEGKLAPPLPVDPAVLAGPLAALESAKPDVSAPLAEWRPGTEAGELRGPAWHGPVTFLLLRTLSDVVHGVAPHAPPPPAPEPPPKPKWDLPPPAPSRPSNAPGTAPAKPADPLPVPEEK